MSNAEALREKVETMMADVRAQRVLTREELDKFTKVRPYCGDYRKCEYPGCVDGAEVKVYRWHLVEGEYKPVSSVACHTHESVAMACSLALVHEAGLPAPCPQYDNCVGCPHEVIEGDKS